MAEFWPGFITFLIAAKKPNLFTSFNCVTRIQTFSYDPKVALGRNSLALEEIWLASNSTADAQFDIAANVVQVQQKWFIRDGVVPMGLENVLVIIPVHIFPTCQAESFPAPAPARSLFSTQFFS